MLSEVESENKKKKSHEIRLELRNREVRSQKR